jgi:hypothetical protein
VLVFDGAERVRGGLAEALKTGKAEMSRGGIRDGASALCPGVGGAWANAADICAVPALIMTTTKAMTDVL